MASERLVLTWTAVRALEVMHDGPMNVADFGASMGYEQRAGPRNNLTGARVLIRLRSLGYVRWFVDQRNKPMWEITNDGLVAYRECEVDWATKPKEAPDAD